MLIWIDKNRDKFMALNNKRFPLINLTEYNIGRVTSDDHMEFKT